jgi:hypothetical protein
MIDEKCIVVIKASCINQYKNYCKEDLFLYDKNMTFGLINILIKFEFEI